MNKSVDQVLVVAPKKEGFLLKAKSIGLLDTAIILAAVTGLLYALSIMHLRGYLLELGVIWEFFDFNVQEILFKAFLLVLLAATFSFFGSLVIVYFLWLLSVSVLRLLKRVKWLRAIASAAAYPAKGERREETKLESSLLAALHFIVIGFIVCFIVMTALVISSKFGHYRAGNLLQDIAGKDDSLASFVEISRYQERVFVVACDSENCAGILEESLRVVYFKKVFGEDEVKSVMEPTK